MVSSRTFNDVSEHCVCVITIYRKYAPSICEVVWCKEVGIRTLPKDKKKIRSNDIHYHTPSSNVIMVNTRIKCAVMATFGQILSTCNLLSAFLFHVSYNEQRCGNDLHHDDVIKWKHFPCYWPFVRGIHRSLVNTQHKGQWRRALMLYLICVWINGWVNNREAGDLRRFRVHYDVTVMITPDPWNRSLGMYSPQNIHKLSCSLHFPTVLNIILYHHG